MAEQLEKRYILIPESGSVRYDIDHTNQTISLKVDIEKLSEDLMSDDTFKNYIISAIAKQLTDSEDIALTEAIGDTAVNAVRGDILNNTTEDTAEKNNLYNVLARQIFSDNAEFHPVIVHGTSAPNEQTINDYPNAYIYIQHD